MERQRKVKGAAYVTLKVQLQNLGGGGGMQGGPQQRLANVEQFNSLSVVCVVSTNWLPIVCVDPIDSLPTVCVVPIHSLPTVTVVPFVCVVPKVVVPKVIGILVVAFLLS